MMRRSLLLIPLLLASSLAMAQQMPEMSPAGIQISGSVSGYDGAPMKLAHVHLVDAADASDIIETSQVAADGVFRLAVQSVGAYTLQFTGVDHQMLEIPLLLPDGKSVEMNVRLEANRLSGDAPTIIGDFNEFNFRQAEPMQKGPNGTWIYEFETPENTVAYQILGTTNGHSVNGTMAEDYIYDGGGDYRSVVAAKNGRVKIVLDPAMMPTSEKPASITFADPKSVPSRIAMIAREQEARVNAYRTAFSEHMEAGGSQDDFSYDMSKDLKAVADQIRSEKNDLVRGYMLMNYAQLGMMIKDAPVEKELVAANLSAIAADSPLLALQPSMMLSLYQTADRGDDFGAFADQVAETHPDKGVRAAMVFFALMQANNRDGLPDMAAMTKYYNQLLNDFPETQYAQYADYYSPHREVMAGRMVPDFRFVSMEDPDVVFTRENMLGKYYLIDFWAVWCGPCRAEMPNLHAAYEKYAGPNFEVLSLSFDQKPEDVTEYRADKFPMPWQHSFIENGFKNDASKAFEVRGIPKPILVGPDGMIIATETSLRGEALDATLAKHVGLPDQAAR